MNNTNMSDDITSKYRYLCRIPTLVDARFVNMGTTVQSIWSQRNAETGKTVKFLQSHNITPKIIRSDHIPQDISNELLSSVSPSGKLRAVIREVDGKQYLEIWRNDGLMNCVDLAALDVHGSIYTDAEFKTFEWSSDETKILYIAEEKQPKTEPFYKRSAKKKTDNEPIVKGAEYLYRQEWGEQMVGKSKSVIAEYSIAKDTVEILKGPPEDICPAQVIYSKCGTYLIGVAYKTIPRKYGLVFCTNRLATIFKLDFNEQYEELDLKNKSVMNPKLSTDGKTLIWLQRDAGGPHAAALSLMKLDISESFKKKPIVVVDIVRDMITIENGKIFYGLYNPRLIKNCFISNNTIVYSTIQLHTIKTYIINLDSKKITQIGSDSNTLIVVDVFGDMILLNSRNFLKPDQLKIYQNSGDVVDLTEPEDVHSLENMMYQYLELEPESKSLNEDCKTFCAIYLGPKAEDVKSTKLVVWPHGGPHSAFSNGFSLELSLLLSTGFAVVLVNYRGSLGAGQNSVEYLLGKVGISDVEDCVLATKTALEKFHVLNSDRVALVGGSHGGFLVTHISGQFPDMYKAVVARNPVIDIAVMSGISDIPDWSSVELGTEYSEFGQIDDDSFLKMRKASPIKYAHRVKAPTLLQLGVNDLRVPYYQGLQFYNRLQANGTSVKLNLYKDNHPLGTVPNEMDNLINTVLWLLEHLDKPKTVE